MNNLKQKFQKQENLRKYLLYETFPLSLDELIFPSWNNRGLHQVFSETEGCAEILLYACISVFQQQPVAHWATHPGLALTQGIWKNQSITENSAQERKHLQPKSWNSHLPSSCNNYLLFLLLEYCRYHDFHWRIPMGCPGQCSSEHSSNLALGPFSIEFL